MRIACPNCEKTLSFGAPSPGKYKPKCNYCGRHFRLKVSDDDPPKIRFGKLKADGSSAASHPDSSSTDRSHSARSSRPVGPATRRVGSNHTTISGEETIDATIDQAVATGVNHTRSPGSTVANSVASRRRDDGTQPTLDSHDASSNAPSNGEAVRVSSARDAAQPARVSAKKVKQPKASASDDEISTIPERLGGYKILKMLGRGAMGAVYQATQISLDRNVALKTIRSRLAKNPASLARFTREAYAAAQLTHHNVVQIYDFGEDGGQHFFSMEWVRGGTLHDAVRDNGPLDSKLAAGYVLQAARGLQFAHRNGMVHRDIKPANLLLSDEGVVKVADLGLVKIPEWAETESEPGHTSVSGMQSGTQVTMQGTAVGTPAYMAPEQSSDSTTVDHRADIYSLGCSLFYLLAGRAPFDGSVVSEVLEKHARKPIPNISEINSRVPKQLISVIEKCMAKQPDGRYESLAQMIRDLEAFMGIASDGDFSPTTQQADQWEAITNEYNSTQKTSLLLRPAFTAFAVTCLVLTLAVPIIALPWSAVGPITWISGIVTALIFGGLRLAAPGRRSAVAASIRSWIASLGWLDYALGLFAILISSAIIFLSGLTTGVFVGATIGVLCGAAFHFGLIVPAWRSGRKAIENAERFVRNLRIQGADEEGLRNFAARYAGKKWEPIYETLFGYSALQAAKKRLSGDPSFAAPIKARDLRDKVIIGYESKAKARKEARNHKQLARIEQRGLVSEGLTESEARERSWQMASALMEGAKMAIPSNVNAEAEAMAKRARIKADLAEARSGKYKRKRDSLAPVKLAFSGYLRLPVGCLLVAAFVVWAQSTGLLAEIQGGEFDWWMLMTNAEGARNALGLNPFSVGAAGVLLTLSAFVSGWRITPFAVAATIVIIFGVGLGIPSVAIVPAWLIALAAGVIVYIPGILFGESPLPE